MTNDSGQVVEGIGYDSFGNSTGSALTRYTYTGREFDAEYQLAEIIDIYLASPLLCPRRTIWFNRNPSFHDSKTSRP